MKTSITLSLDSELVTLLNKERDKNILINSYLIHYFGLKEAKENNNNYSQEEELTQKV